jgi:hypothetical protein
VSSSTGGKFVSDQVGAPPDIPLLSYFKRAFNGLSMNSNFPQGYVQIAGNLTSWTINVTKPYSGAMASFVAIIYMGGWAIEGSGPNLYFKVIKQVIDLKTAGLRTITANGTSGAVAPSGTASVTSLTWSSTSGGQVAVVMASPSSYVLGDTINVSGATNSGTGSLSLLNTTHTINTWTDSTHFTFKLPGTSAIWGTLGGTILLQIGGDSISAVPFWLVGGHPVVIGPTNGAGDTLGNGYRMVMVAQTDQGVDAASIILNNVATGSGVTLDEFADTVVSATLEGP